MLATSLNSSISPPPPSGEVPTFSKELKDVSTAPGEDAVFLCELSQAGLDVIWYKNGKSIQKSLKYEMIQENKDVKLIVHSVTAKDSGEYSCEVTGGPTSKAQLEIKGASSVIHVYVFDSNQLVTMLK